MRSGPSCSRAHPGEMARRVMPLAGLGFSLRLMRGTSAVSPAHELEIVATSAQRAGRPGATNGGRRPKVVVLDSRLRAPTPRKEWLQRDRLISSLIEAADKRVILIDAPI